MSLRALILAAGKGTRMKSFLPKVLHKVCGKPMLQRVIELSKKIGSEETIVVLGHKKDSVLEAISDTEIKYVIQEKQLGTGDAVIQAKSLLGDFRGTVMVLYGDTPLLRKETLREMYQFHKKSGATATILTSIFENPFGYGRILKSDNEIVGIVEENEATEEQKKIREINAGIYCFESQELFEALSKIDNKNEKGEYYLTDVISVSIKDGKKVQSFVLEDRDEVLGINSKIELERANNILKKRINEKHMENGVILIDSNNTYIDDEVVIGEDTVVAPNVVLQGKTKIGRNCNLMSGTRIIDSYIADDVRIESSVIEESIVQSKVTIGPFAHLRPKSHLKENVHIGNFVEIKKSILEEGVKAGHLSYLGDSTVGSGTNIGAGTITCNYDGQNKFKTIIGKNAFIGGDTVLVAPVNIGENTIIGAGSVITKDVPDNALGVARGKQIIKSNWRK